jgi:hypothetical protein
MRFVREIHLHCQKTPDKKVGPLRETPSHFDTAWWKINRKHIENREDGSKLIVALHDRKKEPSYLQGFVEEVLDENADGKVDIRVRKTSRPMMWGGNMSGERGYVWDDYEPDDGEWRDPDFNPASLDADPNSIRRLLRASVIFRQGQRLFRQKLYDAYGRRCAVTGCEVFEILEAAHIVPYKDGGPNAQHVQNGLLLRADIHSLFDRCLIGFKVLDDRIVIEVSPDLKATEYYRFNDVDLTIPAVPHFRPSHAAIIHRRTMAPLDSEGDMSFDEDDDE